MPSLLGVTKVDGKKKPAIIRFYNWTKSDTDIIAQRISVYIAKLKLSKWAICEFSYMLDVASINAPTVALLKKMSFS